MATVPDNRTWRFDPLEKGWYPENNGINTSGASLLSNYSQASGGLSAGGAGGYAGAVAIGMMVGKAVGDTYATYRKGKTQRFILRQKARVSDANAKLMQLGVEQANRAGEAEIAALTMKAAQVKADQRTAFAANGIAVDGTGSTAEAYATTDLNKEVDRLTAESNALANAWGYKRYKIAFETDAKVNRDMAKNTHSLWNLATFTTLLNSAGSVGSTWYGLSGKGGGLAAAGATKSAS